MPNVTWFKDTNRIEFGGRNFFSPNTKTLLISDITVADSGRYTCEVTNVVGTIRHSADLTVLDSQANGMCLLSCIYISCCSVLWYETLTELMTIHAVKYTFH